MSRPITPDPRTRRGRAPAPPADSRMVRQHGRLRAVPSPPSSPMADPDDARRPRQRGDARRDLRRTTPAHPPHRKPSRPAPPPRARELQRRAPRVPKVARRVFRAGKPRRRLLAVFIVTTLVFLAVIGRVVLLQTSDAQALQAAGRAQRTSTIILKASRGTIFDRNGEELALSVPATTIVANPKLVEDVNGTVDVLAKILQLDDTKRAALTTALSDKTKGFAYVARQVDTSVGEAVAALNLSGIDTVEEDRRTLPSGEVGKSVIGKTDIDSIGIAGVEKQFNTVLQGSDGKEVRQHDAQGRTLPGQTSVVSAAVPGDDLILTIDRSLQYTVEQALLQQVLQLTAKSGSAIVMSTKTGEIVSMASVDMDKDGNYQVTSGNLAAVDAAEPGSVVKAITIAAALNEGVVTPESTFEVPWQKQFSDTMLHDAEVHPTEPMPVRQILTESSNIGTIEIMERLSDESFRAVKEKEWQYMRAFGLGQKTALDFPGESAGLLTDWKKLEGAEQYTVAYGQGVGSTSIQLIAAINTLANGGMYVSPKLVKATLGPDGTMTPTAPAAEHRVVSEIVARDMNSMMQDVVCYGTAKAAQVDGVTIAGKTGTGLKAQPGGGYIDKDGFKHYYASFVGFFPAEDPQVTVLVSIDEPPADSNARFGGTAAAPVFAQIAPAIMHQLNVTPPNANGGCPAPTK